MNQRVARKVIYTTHSVGCLPPDLGGEIRAVIVEPGAERSRIANSYWSLGKEEGRKAGHAPLLLAMGASLLALTVPRYGLLVEGPSDAIALPTLIRAAAGVTRLPYRVAPGLAEIATSNVVGLADAAAAVAYLTDGDERGREIARLLEGAGVDPSAVFCLADFVSGLTLEDLYAPNAFAQAVNHEIEAWGLGPWKLDPASLPETGRWEWLMTAADDQTDVSVLSKPRVAQRLVDASRGDTPVAPLHEAWAGRLADLNTRLCEILRAPAE